MESGQSNTSNMLPVSRPRRIFNSSSPPEGHQSGSHLDLKRDLILETWPHKKGSEIPGSQPMELFNQRDPGHTYSLY